MKNARLLFYLVLLAVSAAHAAERSDNKAYQIMAESEARDTGWRDSSADMRMIIRRGDGREVVRVLRSKSLEGDNGEDKSLSIFDEPLDVRGTVFLTHTRPLDDDLQWIFLPSQKRVKRISSRGQTGRFMGSEFTYEDMASFALQKFDYRYLDEEPCGPDAAPCHKIESLPKNRYSGYERMVSWIDQDELRTWKIQMYSKRTGKLSKTLTLADYELHLDRYWRPGKLVMKNERSGAVTELHWQNQQFGVGLSENEFRRSALERRQ